MEGQGTLIDEEVTGVIIAILVVIGVFVAAQFFISGKVAEPYSDLAILGPEGKLSDYPSQVAAGKSFNLSIYVGNHEGKVMYYAVLVKLGSVGTPINETNPMDAPEVERYEVVLTDGGNWTKQITLSVQDPGINRRLVFELWVFDGEAQEFEYHSRWNQLWLNVTAPALP